MLGGRGPFTVLLDTGDAAPYAVVLSPRAAGLAGATPDNASPLVSRAVVGAQAVTLRPIRLATVEFGPIRLSNVSAATTEAIDTAGEAMGRRFDAVIGYRLLAGRVIAIDYPCRRVDFAATPPPIAAAAKITIAQRRPVSLVSARINGHGPFRLALDTAAADTILSPKTASAAGVRRVRRTVLAGAGGVEPDAWSGRAQVALGALAPRRTDVVVSALVNRVAKEAGAPIDGIAGTPLFAQVRLTLDYRQNRVWFQRPRVCGT
jgi:predicted aspartyl protease